MQLTCVIHQQFTYIQKHVEFSSLINLHVNYQGNTFRAWNKDWKVLGHMSAKDKMCFDIFQKWSDSSRNMYSSIIFWLGHLSDQTGICTDQFQKCSENVRCRLLFHILHFNSAYKEYFNGAYYCYVSGLYGTDLMQRRTCTRVREQFLESLSITPLEFKHYSVRVWASPRSSSSPSIVALEFKYYHSRVRVA